MIGTKENDTKGKQKMHHWYVTKHGCTGFQCKNWQIQPFL